MSSLIDFIEVADVENTLSAIRSHGVDLEEAAVREIARQRILDAVRPIISLRYIHSKSKLDQVLSGLRRKEIASSFALFGLDAESFTELAECHVRRLGTTRPNDWWRKNGVGRPKRAK
ncbi:MAG: hypothetical protein PXX77_11300 [Gallionella sp.]|nr:hypothetical protein [Gallionella sp.]